MSVAELFRCQDCDRVTSQIEASQRLFNAFRCVCGGELRSDVIRAELRIGAPGGNFVLVDCHVELLVTGGVHPWRATCPDTGHVATGTTRTAAVLALFAKRLGAGAETWEALGGAEP